MMTSELSFTEPASAQAVGPQGKFAKRVFDLTLAIFLAVVLFVPFVLLTALVWVTSGRPVLYWSDRVGRMNEIFRMPKFRSMRTNTPEVATHHLTDFQNYMTPIGGFLRKTSLDEVPQLWSIIKGDMSFVGPRPALYNQDDLIELRTQAGVHRLKPGLTGWAQINGRDSITIPEKVRLDAEYMQRQSLLFDVQIMVLTAFRILKREDISH